MLSTCGSVARRASTVSPMRTSGTPCATRRLVVMDDDLIMMIGPDSAGSLLEVGVLGMNGETQMRRTEDEIKRAAKRFDRLADDLDPATTDVLRTEDLREVAAASEAVRANESQLREAVEIARAHGRSWNEIAVALGVSRQAARQRFTAKVPS